MESLLILLGKGSRTMPPSPKANEGGDALTQSQQGLARQPLLAKGVQHEPPKPDWIDRF